MMPRMDIGTTLLFAATVLPLICTPGPDMLLIGSQALSRGAFAGVRATAGVCLGYVVHSLLVAYGVAAILAASPLLFAGLRWLGVAYLAYLAVQFIRSALRPGEIALPTSQAKSLVRRGFLTAFLNPKGIMIYFAILPHFINESANVTPQALTLSAVFIGLLAIAYSGLSVVIAALARNGRFSEHRRKWVEGTAGGLLIVAASRMAVG